MILVLSVGCGSLEPIVESDASDLQLTVDTLKTAVRDAQRTIAELRAELDSRRLEIADVQIARAQLDGRVREAERRLVEARQVIDLQREELAGSRSERERVARTGVLLQNQMKQLQKQLSKLSKQTNESRSVTPASLPTKRRTDTAPIMSGSDAPREASTEATPAFHVPPETSGIDAPVQNIKPIQVSVKAGDTLWSIAQRHRVSVKRLMALNQLPDTHIQVGQALWLSEPMTLNGMESEKSE